MIFSERINMSATSEKLYEKIRTLEESIAKAYARHDDALVADLRAELSSCKAQLAEANQSLSEGKVLKG
jgi:ribosome-interacting GTPase 1